MSRIHLHQKYTFKRLSIKKRTIIIMVIVLIVVSLIMALQFVSNKISPNLLNYAEIEVRKIVGIVINNAVGQTVSNLNLDQLFITQKNANDEINFIDFNPVIVNQMLSKLTSSVQKNLLEVEQGNILKLDIPFALLKKYEQAKLAKGIVYEMPIGLVFNNNILNNLGPKIPVKLSLMGDITSNIETKITNYGINSALIEIFINLKVQEQVLLPFISKPISVNVTIPVAIKLTQGTVPKYYMNGLSKNSPILSLPVE